MYDVCLKKKIETQISIPLGMSFFVIEKKMFVRNMTTGIQNIYFLKSLQICI